MKVLLVLAVLLFSGCSSLYKEAGEKFIKSKNLDKKVTTVCYDYVDKKECPSGTLQYDIDILRFVPDSSRFCFGLTDKNVVFPEGMYCYSRDFIK